MSNVLGLASVDAGEGSVIFALPPAELAAHERWWRALWAARYGRTNLCITSTVTAKTTGWRTCNCARAVMARAW